MPVRTSKTSSELVSLSSGEWWNGTSSTDSVDGEKERRVWYILVAKNGSNTVIWHIRRALLQFRKNLGEGLTGFVTYSLSCQPRHAQSRPVPCPHRWTKSHQPFPRCASRCTSARDSGLVMRAVTHDHGKNGHLRRVLSPESN